MKSPGHPSFPKVCVLVLMLVSYTDAFVVATPRAPRVVSGTATIQQDGNMTVINASNRSVINYQSFDIGPAETVRFVQPNASSTVLNRVLSPNPTNIFGQLQANGIVYIVNPYGVYFQNGSVLNVGGLVAAAGHISDQDFTAGRIHFTDLAGDVRNDGVLAADNRIALLGANVANNGKMTVARGVAMMTSGSDIYVGEKGGNVYVQANGAATASAPAGSVANRGTVAAPRVVLGAGDMYSTAIVNTGLLQGRSVAVNAGRNGTATVGGKLDASASNPKKNAGKGGDIQVTGGTVALQAATLDASGVNGGGSVRVGGDFHGGGTLAHATTTTTDAATTINADATGPKGNGGTVVLWSDTATGFAGQISARGGSTGGDGGSVEVSSKQTLSYLGQTDLRANGTGKTGSLLLDPQFITITDAGTGLIPLNGTVAFGDPPANQTISPVVLGAALLLGNITLQATTDIRFSSSVTVTTGGSNLTLQAGRSILFDNNVTLTLAGALNATFNDAGATAAGTRADTSAGTFTMSAGSTITAPGGVTITGGTYAGVPAGTVQLQNISTASGTAGTPSGPISVENVNNSGGDILSQGTLTTTPTANNTNGGNVTLNGLGAVTLGAINSNGSGTGTGGAVGLTGGTLQLNGAINGGSLTTTGAATLSGGTVTTGDFQTYNDAVTLGADTTLTSNGGGTINLSNTVDGAFSLTLSTTGATTFAGAVGSTTALTSLTTQGGSVTVNGGSVTTIGSQSYGGKVTLGQDTLFRSNGGTGISITFLSTVDSDPNTPARNLSVLNPGGLTQFAGSVGATTPLASLQSGNTANTTGTTRFGTNSTALTVTTTGTGGQSYYTAVNLLGNTTMTATGGPISFFNTLDSDGAANAQPTYSLSLNTTTAASFGGRIGSVNPLTGLNITATTTSFAFAAGAGAGVQLGTGGLTITSAAGATNPSTTLNITGSVLTDASRPSILSAGPQTYGNNVTLAADTFLRTTAAGSAVTFNGTVDATVGGGAGLSVNGAGGEVFRGTVGGTFPLLSLRTGVLGNAGAATFGPGVVTVSTGSGTGADLQTYGDALVLQGTTTTFRSRDAAGTAAGTGAITFGRTVDGATNYAQSLTADTRGATTFSGLVGRTTPLNALTSGELGSPGSTTFNVNLGTALPAGAAGSGVAARTVTINDLAVFNVAGTAANRATVTTTGVQSYNGAVRLGADTILTSLNTVNDGGTITFAQTVDGDAPATPRALTVNTPGDEVFSGRVGSTNPLGSLATDATGTVGGTARFNMTVTPPAGGGVAAGVTVGAGGIVTNDSTVFNVTGGNTPATPGVLALANGTQTYSVGNANYTATTTVAQDTVLVGIDATVVPTTTAGYQNGGAVTFAGAVAGTGTQALTIYTGAGTTSFEGDVNVGTLDAGGAQVTFARTVSALSLLRTVANPGGTGLPLIDIDANVTTVGAQEYRYNTVLSADVTLTSTGGGNLTFDNRVDSLLTGYYTLTLNTNGSAIFRGQVGGLRPLRGLTVGANPAYRNGLTVFNYAGGTTAAPSVKTINNGVAGAGVQEYYNRVRLNADTVLASVFTGTGTVGGNFIFHGTVNSFPGGPNYRLELNTSGNETFLARVGDENPLLSFTTDADANNRGGATIFNVPGSATTAPTVRTTGVQTYSDRVFLALDTVLTGGGSLTFNSFVDSLSSTSLGNLELNSPANEVFRANVGGTNPLLSLVTDADPANRGGATVFGAAGGTGTLSVVTVNNGAARGGVQTFNDAVVLNLDTTLTSRFAGAQTVGGNITFNATVDGPRGLTVNTGALTVFNQLVGSVSPLAFLTTDGQGAAGEGTQFLMPIPANTAGVRVGGDVTVGDPVLFNAAGGIYPTSPTVLTFNNGRQSYLGNATVSANTTLVGTASPTAPAVGVYAGGNAILFAKPVASANASNLTIYTGTGTTTFRSTVTVGSVDLQGANVTFADNVTGLGALLVGRNDAAAGVIDLNGGTVQTSAGLTALTGDQYYRDAASLSANARLTDTAGSNVYFASTVDGTYALSLNTTGDEYLQGFIGRTAPLSSLTIDGAADPAANLGTAHFNMTPAGQGTGVASVRVGAGGVLINDTTAFNVAGSTQANPTLLVYGNGTQTYNGTVTLQADTVLVGTDAATAPTTTAYTGGGAILFARTVTGTTTPAPNLSIYTGAGLESYRGTVNVNTLISGGATVTFAGNVSGINTLQTVANPTDGVPTGTVDINNDITTFNGQTYNAAAVLSQDVTLTSTGNGDIRSVRTLDSDNSGTYALTINTSGATVFGGFVGGNRALFSLVTGAGGVAQINGRGVTTTRFQTYGDAVTLGDDTTLTSTDGGDIRFNSTLDGAHDLTVRTPADEYFEGLVGSTAALTNLTVDDLLPPGGTAHFDMTVGTAAAGVNVTGIVTVNDAVVFNAAGASLDHPTVLAGVQQTYGSLGNAATPVTLLQPTFLQSATTNPGIEGIIFRSTVDGASDLTLNTLGDEVFDAVVGGTTPLASLTVDNLYNPSHTPDGGTTGTRFGTTIFTMTQPAVGAGVNVSGSVEINDQVQFSVDGSSVTDPAHPSVLTGGAQTYYSLATLVTDTSLRSSGSGNITFNSGVTSALAAPRALAVFTDGEKVFNGTVGTNALLSLTTSAGGATRINGVNVVTTGFQTYNSPVLLGADTNLLSFGGGDITFNATLDSDSAISRALTINTAGNEVFNDRVGSLFALRSLQTDTDPGNRGGAVIFNVAGGANTVTTTDFQTYNDAVQLGQDTFLTSTGGGAILFNQAVNGPGALTLSTAGDMTFQAPVGEDTPLAGLTAGGGGTIFLDGARVTTTGSQSYNGPVLLSKDTTLVSGDAVRFAFTLDGAYTLTINAAGDEFFEDLVGSQSALANLFIDEPTNFGGTAHFDMGADGAAAGVNITGNLAIRDNTAFNVTLTGTGLVPTVRTGGSQAYQGTVTAGSAGTTFLQSTDGNVLFLNDVSVASNLLRVDARNILAHDIRAASGDNHSLDLEATELLLLAGNTYSLGTGSISLNTDSTGRGGLSDARFNDASTIVLKPEGGSQVNFTAGDFAMGYLQTMLAFGSVNIRAGSEATLSSIEATGSLTVDAPNITLLSRPTSISLRGRNVGLIFAATQIDFGGGNVRFRNTRSGDAAQAAFFSTVGSVVIQRVPGVSLFSDPNLRTRFEGLNSAAYENVARTTTADTDGTMIPVSNELSNLPVLSLNTLQGNQFLDVAAALAGALPLLNHDLDLPSDGLAITAAQLEQLKKLGINPRLAERNERSSIRDKRALFAQLVDKNDTENYGRLQPIKGAVSRLVPSDFVVVVDRMSAVEVQSILQAFEQVYGKDQAKVPAISDKIQAAYVDHVTASPNGGNDGHGFAAFVQKNPAKYGDLNPTVRDFDNLFGRLEGLGLTEVEVAKSEEHIVHNVQPTGLSDGETRRFINDLRKGLPTDQRAPSNSQPPSPPVAAPEKKPTPAPHTAGRQKTEAPAAARQARRAPVPTPAPGQAVAER